MGIAQKMLLKYKKEKTKFPKFILNIWLMPYSPPKMGKELSFAKQMEKKMFLWI